MDKVSVRGARDREIRQIHKTEKGRSKKLTVKGRCISYSLKYRSEGKLNHHETSNFYLIVYSWLLNLRRCLYNASSSCSSLLLFGSRKPFTPLAWGGFPSFFPVKYSLESLVRDRRHDNYIHVLIVLSCLSSHVWLDVNLFTIVYNLDILTPLR